MSVSVILIEPDSSEQDQRYLCTEKEFREFRRWSNLYGEYPILNSFPLRYTGGEFRATFVPTHEQDQTSVFGFLRELADLAERTKDKTSVPSVYNHILYTVMELATEALKQDLTLALA